MESTPPKLLSCPAHLQLHRRLSELHVTDRLAVVPVSSVLMSQIYVRDLLHLQLPERLPMFLAVVCPPWLWKVQMTISDLLYPQLIRCRPMRARHDRVQLTPAS